MTGIPPLAIDRTCKPQDFKLPKALSVGEETFALHMKARGLKPVREFRFHPERRWRFDFAFLDRRTIHGNLLAVECDGGSRSRGRHTRSAGFEGDLEKINAAIMRGWVVLRFTTEMITRGAAELKVAQILGVT